VSINDRGLRHRGPTARGASTEDSNLGCACHVGISDVAVLPREEAACDTTVESAIEVRFANHEEMTIVAFAQSLFVRATEGTPCG